jgi:hypothetical protein
MGKNNGHIPSDVPSASLMFRVWTETRRMSIRGMTNILSHKYLEKKFYEL